MFIRVHSGDEIFKPIITKNLMNSHATMKSLWHWRNQPVKTFTGWFMLPTHPFELYARCRSCDVVYSG